LVKYDWFFLLPHLILFLPSIILFIRKKIMKRNYLIFSILIGVAIISCKNESVVNPVTQQLYTLSNQSAENKLLVYNRLTNGSLEYDTSVSLTGKGTGALLGSANPLTSSADGNWLFAVNAGSNSLTSIDIRGSLPIARDTIGTNGVKPVSVAVFSNWVYVLNQGGNGSICGFIYDGNGSLNYIPNSFLQLGTGPVNPAQISFNNEGTALIVTEKDSSKLDLIHLDNNGGISSIQKFASFSGKPYGFARNNNNYVFCSEALQNYFSVYKVNSNSIDLVSTPVSTAQTGACWVGLLPNQKYAYMLMAGTSCLTGFDVSSPTTPSLLNIDGNSGSTGNHPIEFVAAKNSKLIYVLCSGTNSINVFDVSKTGTLNPVQEKMGLPASTVGLALKDY
jgi:6-phosphogluconolactonase